MKNVLLVILCVCLFAMYVASVNFSGEKVYELDPVAFVKEVQRCWPIYDPIRNFLELYDLPQEDRTFWEYLKWLGQGVFDSLVFPVTALGYIINIGVAIFNAIDELVLMEGEEKGPNWAGGR